MEWRVCRGRGERGGFERREIKERGSAGEVMKAGIVGGGESGAELRVVRGELGEGFGFGAVMDAGAG